MTCSVFSNSFTQTHTVKNVLALYLWCRQTHTQTQLLRKERASKIIFSSGRAISSRWEFFFFFYQRDYVRNSSVMHCSYRWYPVPFSRLPGRQTVDSSILIIQTIILCPVMPCTKNHTEHINMSPVMQQYTIYFEDERDDFNML